LHNKHEHPPVLPGFYNSAKPLLLLGTTRRHRLLRTFLRPCRHIDGSSSIPENSSSRLPFGAVPYFIGDESPTRWGATCPQAARIPVAMRLGHIDPAG
jgi:hypothetical protein